MKEKHDPASMIGLMPRIKSYDTTLSELGQWWQKVALVGKINSLGIAATLLGDMESTRRKLAHLQQNLIDNLVRENLRKLHQELSASTQVAIDILIRNLFERTADVGFLATDDDLRTFLRTHEPNAAAHAAIIERLREYTLKYSVYDEIVLLAPDGAVIAHLDESNPISHSSDPLIARTLGSDAPYIESFGHSDLQPLRRHSLIYSARITDPDAPRSTLLGILCLCFRFDDEMAEIFSKLKREGETLAILEDRGSVIATSDHKELPLGSYVERSNGDEIITVHHDNRPCFAKMANTSGYQGFFGLGWHGYGMRPAATTFLEQDAAVALERSLIDRSNHFSRELRDISRAAATIIDDLILVVLNGQIVSAKRDAKEFMPVLEEIRNIGNQTKEVFDNSITNLYNTVIASLLNDVQFRAFLAVDIMDRNLYERANDVRWWALTTKFRTLMAKPALNEDDHATLASTLSYINGLYTVYTNLFLFDTRGKIIAASNPDTMQSASSRLPLDGCFNAALNVRESHQYVVSPFEATPLYDGDHTYIYLTSIRKQGSDSVCGGIGIVFDAAPQFRAMLNDALPRDDSGEVIRGAFALFTDSDGRVIASTNPAYSPGDEIDLERRFFALKNGERTSALGLFQGSHYAIGAAMSQGYREYKTTNDYTNDVVCLVFVPV